MEDEHQLTESQLTAAIQQLCQSKADEFRLIGYEHVTYSDVWECVSSKYKKDIIPPMHELVNDILSLKVMKFMNFLTISAYKGSHFN
ncbi:hypothetical protein J2Z69_000023 [Paenibacillus shirakamiensis]|uniref:Post-transcriptional regulator n=1 Tax=Paenibacillus shirakamiensis TaxID=1265935 RepID=A0ABS4JEI3_9BACL|nr:post-transcriptional regulator [Paenibacillus shirakamiensis]MBP1999004.1 hypothetical protein [Paenibacillus shirakamiensis]